LLVACFMRTCIFSMSSSVFFSCLLIHLDRHSFPTRRSSDLGTYKFYGNTDYYDILFKDRRSHVMHNLSVSGGSDKLRGVISGRRSEEHTSELQSRFEIVCCLLLEQKNKSLYRLAHNNNLLYS